MFAETTSIENFDSELFRAIVDEQRRQSRNDHQRAAYHESVNALCVEEIAHDQAERLKQETGG